MFHHLRVSGQIFSIHLQVQVVLDHKMHSSDLPDLVSYAWGARCLVQPPLPVSGQWPRHGATLLPLPGRTLQS